MILLSIDTSCDDTSVAILENSNILANCISSQIQFHKEWGGVVPSLAQRLHKEKIDIVIKKALKQAKKTLDDIDVFAVTYGPGLAIALEVGVQKAKELAATYHKPLVPVNHMEGHIYSAFAKNKYGKGHIEPEHFPYLCLLVSGGHTELILMKEHGTYEKLGETLDDAVGEAFDKVSKMLDLGYPGGPIIANFANQGNEERFDLPIPLRTSPDCHFSYSGLKTAVSRLITELKQTDQFGKQEIYDISASFQKVAIAELILKTNKALHSHTVNGVILAGGVSANIYLRKELRKLCKRYGIPLYLPLNKKLCMDNAAMIGVCAYHHYRKHTDGYWEYQGLDRDPGLSL